MTSGTSATRCSPAAVSFGTPIRMCRAGTYPITTAGGCPYHHSQAATPLRTMTVNLTRIYTRLGDGGETHLGDMSRVSKLHPRVEAYGTVDELNATIGVALLAPGMPKAFLEWLRRVQNDLLDVGADLSVPPPSAEAPAVAPASATHSTPPRYPPSTPLGMCQARISSAQPTASAKAPPAAATSGRARRGATSTAHSASASAAVEWPLGHEAGPMCTAPALACG